LIEQVMQPASRKFESGPNHSSPQCKYARAVIRPHLMTGIDKNNTTQRKRPELGGPLLRFSQPVQHYLSDICIELPKNNVVVGIVAAHTASQVSIWTETMRWTADLDAAKPTSQPAPKPTGARNRTASSMN